MTRTLHGYCLVGLLIMQVISCKKNSVSDPDSDQFMETDPPALTPVVTKINTVTNGYYIALPVHYDYSTKHYPLLLFIHGGGQFGNGSSDLSQVLNEGIPELLDDRTFPASFTVSNENYSFIVLAPQFTRHPSNKQVGSVIAYALSHYRIDETRVYLSGFSNGGKIVCDYAAENANSLAAIVPIAGVSNTGDLPAKCKVLTEQKLPIWLFHNDRDEYVSIRETEDFVSLLNSFDPVIPPRLTVFPAFGLYGHDAWTKATNPQYQEDGINIYEWMLQYSSTR